MKRKSTYLVLFAMMGLMILTGCTELIVGTTIIDKGFTESLVDALQNEYGLYIPDSADFVEGEIDQSFRDPSICILFRVPEADFETMISPEWVEEVNISGDINGIPAENVFTKTAARGGYLYISAPKNGQIDILFYGENPLRNWIK